MKLEEVLDQLNSFEKNSFLKIIDLLISDKPARAKEIDKILNDASGDLKAMDSINITKVFNLLKSEFSKYLEDQFLNSTTQIDILSDIMIRDGNCIMKQDWLSRLYDAELKLLKKKISSFREEIESEKPSFDEARQRDYWIYKSCVDTAYTNDDYNNQERKITFDEQTILNTLSDKLDLSNEEIKLLNYMVVPLKKMEIDSVVTELRNNGVIFFSKKTNMVYAADEIVTIVRKLKGKRIADKYFRRILRQLREPQINLICKKHNIDWRQDVAIKTKEIINEGISLFSVLSSDIHKPGMTLTEKKKFLNDLFDNKLGITPKIGGSTIEDKLNNLVAYFDDLEADDKVGISIDGYEKLLLELVDILPETATTLKKEFELQEDNVMNSSYLLAYNIKPRDVLEIISPADLQKFCEKSEIKVRGDLVGNILEAFKDSENLYLENFELIGFRKLNELKENGIKIKEGDIGVLFEDLTKKIFSRLGFNVNEDLRKRINTSKDKADIIISISETEIIIVECKSVKENGYNKFSSVSRQLKSYMTMAEKNDLRVIKSLLVAPEFSDEFIKECGLDYDLNLSLITARSLSKILKSFKDSKLSALPHNLFMRDVLIQEDRVIKSIAK